MAVISVKKIGLIVAAILIATISTITIINRIPKSGPVTSPVIEDGKEETAAGDENVMSNKGATGEISMPDSESEASPPPSVYRRANISGHVLARISHRLKVRTNARREV